MTDVNLINYSTGNALLLGTVGGLAGGTAGAISGAIPTAPVGALAGLSVTAIMRANFKKKLVKNLSDLGIQYSKSDNISDLINKLPEGSDKDLLKRDSAKLGLGRGTLIGLAIGAGVGGAIGGTYGLAVGGISGGVLGKALN